LATEIPVEVIKAAADNLRSFPSDKTKSALEAVEKFQREGKVPNPELEEEIKKWLLERLPVFIYFEDYGRLRTRINLQTYLAHKANPQSLPSDERALFRTQTALFEWTKLEPAELHSLGVPKQANETQEQVERRKAERSRLLESASYRATGAWIEWWDPRTSAHTLIIEADGDDLELRIADDVNPWKIPFSDRARGFQWFFSFYLTFLIESEKAHRGAILLLDEPGLHLHLTQQLKLLAFFQRMSKKNQIIYSSHSPFMVDPDRVDNVRTVYLRPRDESDPKSRAYTRVSVGPEPEGDRETLLPMQAAGAYQVAQTIFLGKRTLIVEGISDYWLLRSMSSWLRERGRESLHEDTVIVWAGGTAHLMPLASIMASREQMGPNRMAVLLDSDKAGLNKAKDLVKLLMPEVTKAGNLLLLGDIVGVPGAEIEDLVEPKELLDALKRAGRTYTGTPRRQAGERNVPFLQRVFSENAWGEVTVQEKARIVLALVDTWRTGTTEPHPATLERVAKVFQAINGCFEQLFAN